MKWLFVVFFRFQEFWPNSDLNSSFGSVPRRPNLSTKDVAGDRLGGLHVVAGDHHDSNVRRVGLTDGFWNPVARRIHRREEAEELEVFAWVERFGRRGTEPNELFRSESGQNSFKLQEFSLESSKISEIFNIF